MRDVARAGGCKPDYHLRAVGRNNPAECATFALPSALPKSEICRCNMASLQSELLAAKTLDYLANEARTRARIVDWRGAFK
ncbi:MAG: hypothetical protein DBX55_03580 [Verrucomicrobia bacterium]|nr:MAG: hypothetical protein DBX55_03580 [Verrucomicrobiota bacterium]